MNYTTIDHDVRLKYGLSCNDYCVADKIYHLANNPTNTARWCYASRQSIGEMLGMSRQTIITIIKKLEAKKLVEVHPETDHLRTTQEWYRNFTPCKETLHPTRKESLQGCQESLQGCKESLHNNNIDNNINKKDDDVARTHEEKKTEPLPAVEETRANTQPYLAYEEKMNRWASVCRGPGQLQDLVRKNNKLTEPQYMQLLDTYVEKQRADAKSHADETDFRRHFQFWVPKYLNSDEHRKATAPAPPLRKIKVL